MTDKHSDGWQNERGTVTDRRKDRLTDEGESDRVQICFLFQIKGQPVQRLGQAPSDPQIKQSSAALEGRGPL